MGSFVRVSLIGLVVLVAIGFAVNQQQTNGDGDEVLPTVTQELCIDQGTSLVIDFGTNESKPLCDRALLSAYAWLRAGSATQLSRYSAAIKDLCFQKGSIEAL